MNNKLNLELAKEYYKLAPRASVTFYALIAVSLYFYWGKIPSPILLTWVAVTFVGATLFLVAARLFKRHGTESNAADWLRIYAYLVLFQDAPWGLIGPMSFMIESDVYRMLTLFMLGGMAAGGIASRGLIFKIYLIALFSLLTPIAITLALQHTAVANGMLALVVIYLMFMLSVAKSYSASINRNILLWLDNEKLVEELRSSHSKIEETNRVLTQEIEQRKKIESELVESKERAEQANEAKNQFLATVSHELRTPLNGIIGLADFLRGEKLEKLHQRYVGQVSKAAQALLRLVNDILDITAIEAGHVSFHEEPFSLRDEIEDLLAIVQSMAKRKKLTLKLHVDDDVEDALCGDANRLRQIISNLLSNALKYTEVGGVNLNISRLKPRNGKVVLRFDVEDTGIGIATDALDAIFEKFNRLESFETRRNEGAGLGLPIVESLVQKMDGNLSVHSIPGKGSCFSIELAFDHSKEPHKNARHTQAHGLPPVKWHNFNVLVVDDNELNRLVLTTFLTKVGIPYVEAINGHEALECLCKDNFDVILLDIQMPGISGIDVARRVREEFSSSPVLIAVTAHAFPEQRQAILDAGFSNILIKPITTVDLLETLTQAYRGGYTESDEADDFPNNRRAGCVE
jgi:signal transduction histidine kinase/ActR/RegA family two-component response regulator